MYLVIYNSAIDFPLSLPESRFVKVDIAPIYKASVSENHLYRTNKEEYFLNQVTESLDLEVYSNVKVVIITKELGGNGWGRATNLAGHFACTQFIKCHLNTVPIILTDLGELNIEDPTLKDISVENFLQTEGIYFRKYEDIFSTKIDPITEVQSHSIDNLVRKLKPVNIDRLSIRNSRDSDHQSTNEWGAMRLASNFGLANTLKFKYPRHLYFKYLDNYIDTTDRPVDGTLKNLFSNVLLIDDNAKLGWVELMIEIFSCPVDSLTALDDTYAWVRVGFEKFKKYDLIFLDLYLEKNSLDTKHSIAVLKCIKNKYPQIPVIIFTASDKAWNLDRILEHGADGMCIKESPLYFKDNNYSGRNFEDFKGTIKGVSEKYKVLRPYWEAIATIRIDSNFKGIEDNPKRIRTRIAERLIMFYGLLKKGFEQWDYDKNTFFYSDYELAFMTLWSTLNEIQEGYFKKSRTSKRNLKDKAGNIIATQNDGSSLIPKYMYDWTIKGQKEYYIKYEFAFVEFEPDGTPVVDPKTKLYSLKSTQNSWLRYDSRIPPYYYNELTTDRTNFHKELSNQIAFLILNLNFLKSSPVTESYLISLQKLNGIRNSMYLTHGESKPDYFNTTEEGKRGKVEYHITPSKDIKELFELVAFLLTGDEISVPLF